MRRVLVTGASGLLGFHYAWMLSQQAEVFGVSFNTSLAAVPFQTVKADLSQPDAGKKLLREYEPDLVVHCAALANLEACEKDQALARQLNARLPHELAQTTREMGIQLVHISTDAVFDGEKGDYSEEDQPNPLSVYAQTKWEGEKQVQDADPSALICRVNFFGWSPSGQRSLSEWFVNQLKASNSVFGFTDIVFCPLEVRLLCKTIQQLIDHHATGLFHVVSQDALSKYDFGIRLAQRFGLDERLIQPRSWKDGGLTATRSSRLNLNTAKLQAFLGNSMLPRVEDGIEQFYADYLAGWNTRIQAAVV